MQLNQFYSYLLKVIHRLVQKKITDNLAKNIPPYRVLKKLYWGEASTCVGGKQEISDTASVESQIGQFLKQIDTYVKTVALNTGG